MCTFVILRRPEHNWPVLICANRDELLNRPWQLPGRHWQDRLDVVAGRDQVAGGTWLGINDYGVVAAILNRRGSLGPKEGYRSRGELPLEALDHAESATAAEALANINPASYRPFNMVVADSREAFWIRLAETHWGINVEVKPLPTGLSMITASDRNDKNSSRIRTYLPQFELASEPDPKLGDWSGWTSLMSSQIYDSDGGVEGAMFIVSESGFGTVCSSLVALPSQKNQGVRPIFLFATGRPNQTKFMPVDLS